MPECAQAVQDRTCIMRFEAVSKSFPDGFLHRKKVLQDISFEIYEGEILGLIGASASGKSTLARLMMRLEEPDSGAIYYRDIKLNQASLKTVERRRIERGCHLLFQDAGASLNPHMKVEQIIAEPLRIHQGLRAGDELRSRVLENMQKVGLAESLLSAYPAELSGGQKQRVALARGLILQPELLVADEPLSSLDSLAQVQILELFRKIKTHDKFSLVLISHDISALACLCDRIAVMHQGQLLEIASCDDIFHRPCHPYTRALVRAASYECKEGE